MSPAAINRNTRKPSSWQAVCVDAPVSPEMRSKTAAAEASSEGLSPSLSMAPMIALPTTTPSAYYRAKAQAVKSECSSESGEGGKVHQK